MSQRSSKPTHNYAGLPRHLGFLALLVIAGACATSRPLDGTEIAKLTTCGITLETARKNLLYKGYGVLYADAHSFTTDYKRSDFETSYSTITREPMVAFARRFSVFAVADTTIAFRYQYRSSGHGLMAGTFVNPLFVEEGREIYRRIQEEVCGSAAQPASAAGSSSSLPPSP